MQFGKHKTVNVAAEMTRLEAECCHISNASPDKCSYCMVWYGGRELRFSQPGLPDTGLPDYLLGTDFHHHSLLCVPTVAGLEPTTLPSREAW